MFPNHVIFFVLELSTTELVKKWENWDEATIDGFRIQFQIIDLNEDGLIDFNELYVRINTRCSI